MVAIKSIIPDRYKPQLKSNKTEIFPDTQYIIIKRLELKKIKTGNNKNSNLKLLRPNAFAITAFAVYTNPAAAIVPINR
jgi:hypothetical protein